MSNNLSPIEFSEVKELVDMGKEKGQLTYEEIMDKLENVDLNTEDIERIYDVFHERDIEIIEENEEGDDDE